MEETNHEFSMKDMLKIVMDDVKEVKATMSEVKTQAYLTNGNVIRNKEDLASLTSRIQELEQYKWKLAGAIAIVTGVISVIVSYLMKVL